MNKPAPAIQAERRVTGCVANCFNLFRSDMKSSLFRGLRGSLIVGTAGCIGCA